MDTTTLQAEAKELTFAAFTEETALTLGRTLVDMAREGGLPIVIDIRSGTRTLFHAAMPGAQALNDLWARRKSNTALMFGEASLMVGARNREKGETLDRHGLPAADYADNGGAVPVVVRGVGMVAVATVSGLPQVEDHRLVVRAMRAVLSGQG